MTLPGGRSVPTLVATTLAFFWRGFLDGLSPARAGAGWASRTLVNSLREVVLRAVVSLHVLVLAVVIGQVVGSRPSVGVVAAGAMHLICITVALLALRRPVLGPAFILLTYLGNTLDLLTAPTMASASTFAAIWMLHLTAALSMALIPGRAGIVVPLVGVVVACGVPLLVHPDWESGLFVGAVTATVFIVIATRCGIALLSRLAHQVDEQARVAAAEQRAASWATSAARGTAERGWVLHDTVINTLGAIVRGGAATRDLALVRERCARDAEVVAAMVAGADEPLGGDRGPLAVLEESGLAVEHTGLTPDAVAAASADLPAGQWIAVGRAVHEVLLNVRKHAGVSAVRCDVRRHRGRLHLTVSDAGRGFDPEQVQMRGLSGSVVERCRHVGVDVDVDSRPGGGTSVTFRMGAAKGRGTKAEPQPVGELVIGLRQRAVWAWAWGVLLVSFLLEFVDRPGEWNGTQMAVCVAAAATLVVWWRHDPGKPLTAGSVLLLVVASGAVFVLSLTPTDFASEHPTQWKAVSYSGLMIVAAVLSRSRLVALAVVVMQAVVALVVALTLTESADTAWIVMVGCALSIHLTVGWLGFDSLLQRLGERASADHEVEVAAQAERAATLASEHIRAQGREVGLQRARRLLVALSQGRLDPHDPKVQGWCGEAEAQLRELIRIDPSLVRMGPWLMRGLARAHRRGVRLLVRSGTVEPDNAELADTLGGLLLQTVESVAPGEQLTVSLHPAGEEVAFTLVAPHPRLIAGDRPLEQLSPDQVQVRVETFAGQDLLRALV